jgi:hypothetical protein
VSEICNRFEPLPQVLKNVRYKNGHQPLDNLAVRKAIDSGKSRLGKTGRLVIRPSGTEPVIRVMAEGDDVKLVDTVVSDIVHALTDAAASSTRPGLGQTPNYHDVVRYCGALAACPARHRSCISLTIPRDKLAQSPLDLPCFWARRRLTPQITAFRLRSLSPASAAPYNFQGPSEPPIPIGDIFAEEFEFNDFIVFEKDIKSTPLWGRGFGCDTGHYFASISPANIAAAPYSSPMINIRQ